MSCSGGGFPGRCPIQLLPLGEVHGLLPVINYPLRPYVLPLAIASGVLAAAGIILQVRGRR
jgi:hypothetical protein